MDGNPEGTPNPLNPVQGTASATNQSQPNTGVAAGTGTLDQYETTEILDDYDTDGYNDYYAESTSLTETTTQPTSSRMPEMAKAAPISSSMPNMPTAPRHTVANYGAHSGVIDPMMRPVSHNENSANNQPQTDTSFDSFSELNHESLDELSQDFGQLSSNDSNLVAKDSIVEPVGGSKKKTALIASAIALIMIAIICGVAAIAIVMMNNGGDRVTKAIEKVLNGEVSSIVSVNGKITSTNDLVDYDDSTDDTSSALIIAPLNSASTVINFEGTFDTASSINDISASLALEYPDGAKASVDIYERKNSSGNVFFKVAGLGSIVKAFGTGNSGSEVLVYDESGNESDSVVTTACSTDGSESLQEDCLNSQTSSSMLGGLMTVYGGLLESIDDQWILISEEFADEMGDLEIFDNSSTCTINAIKTLPKYTKDIINSYKANPFVTYSTENLGIAKKKNELYKLSFDNDKMSAFINSLNNNGFINELNACAGNVATNTQVTPAMLETITKDLPAVYAEIDDNNNFTRFYFKAGTASTTIEADINLSYPAEIKVSDPSDYIDMSTLLNSVMTTFLQSGDTPLLESNDV